MGVSRISLLPTLKSFILQKSPSCHEADETLSSRRMVSLNRHCVTVHRRASSLRNASFVVVAQPLPFISVGSLHQSSASLTSISHQLPVPFPPSSCLTPPSSRRHPTSPHPVVTPSCRSPTVEAEFVNNIIVYVEKRKEFVNNEFVICCKLCKKC
ncbi:unnamed protein product [Linum trigynum]|uniref:Uncharacterized protein n=1 Tax=Linum trigynum TaxID=586398 RepID=A0AAV2FVN1_9ROSI